MFAVFFVQCVIGGIEAEPTYPVQTVYPGETATPRVALEKPDNVNVAKENPYKLGDVPSGWTVNIDDNGQITATAPADAKPGDQVKIPVTVTYEDGSTDTAYAVVNVVDVPTREVPFKVEYKYDNTIPAGEYKVETKDEPGSEKMNKDGTWEQTKAPVNEVVVVGTKPAESAKEVRWTVPIPYPTEVRVNPELKPGETKVVQEGKPGEVKHTENTPFDTIIEYDPHLEDGKVVEDQAGSFGEKEITKTWKLKNGKPGPLPRTGTEVALAVAKGLGMIGAGVALTVASCSNLRRPRDRRVRFETRTVRLQ